MSNRHASGIHKRSSSQPYNTVNESVRPSRELSNPIQVSGIPKRQSSTKNYISVFFIAVILYTLYSHPFRFKSFSRNQTDDNEAQLTIAILHDSTCKLVSCFVACVLPGHHLFLTQLSFGSGYPC